MNTQINTPTRIILIAEKIHLFRLIGYQESDNSRLTGARIGSILFPDGLQSLTISLNRLAFRPVLHRDLILH